MDIKGVTEKKVDQLVAAANKVAEFTFIVRPRRWTRADCWLLRPSLLSHPSL